jgi:hypothetical protein
MVTAPGLALVVGISLERQLGRHVSGVARMAASSGTLGGNAVWDP